MVLKIFKKILDGIRAITQLGQKNKDSFKEEYNLFYKNLYNLRFKIGDNENMDNLFNMDETPIMFEMVGKTTIVKIGERNINIRTFGSERSRISVILCISASRSKLPPLLIFKGKKGGYIEDELKKNQNVKAQKIHVLCQENSWADSNVFK